MAKKIYKFNYDYYSAMCKIEVDLDVFTAEMAKSTLEFYSWDYDEEADPIDEVMKKYAMAIIKEATRRGLDDADFVKVYFDEEGFGKVDGSIGVLLTEIESYDFDIDNLEMEVKNG
jgi:hypothetical protein